MPLLTCCAKLNFHFSDLRSLLPRRDTYIYMRNVISYLELDCEEYSATRDNIHNDFVSYHLSHDVKIR